VRADVAAAVERTVEDIERSEAWTRLLAVIAVVAGLSAAAVWMAGRSSHVGRPTSAERGPPPGADAPLVTSRELGASG
ncbi:MAG: hypothetical protein ACK5OX_16610, partial [Desertimonas sp.]